jgi:hypothetical protein
MSLWAPITLTMATTTQQPLNQQQSAEHISPNPQDILLMTSAKKRANMRWAASVTESNPTESEHTETASTHTPPATKDNNSENTGGKGVTEGAEGDDMQAVQHPSSTPSRVGTSSKQGSTLAGLSFRKVTTMPQEGAVPDGEDSERQGKRQRTKSNPQPSPSDIGPSDNNLLDYRISLAPAPPIPKNPAPSTPLHSDHESNMCQRGSRR